MKHIVHSAAALVLALICLLAFGCAAAGGAEPYGDGNGIVSRPLLAAMYNWLSNMDSAFWKQVDFDTVSGAVGKQGQLKEKSGEGSRGAVWTDGDAKLTVTFRDRDGFWSVSGIAISGMTSEEYGVADYSFLPPIGNRDAGSSPTQTAELTTKVKKTGTEVTGTAEVPTENWFAKVSFGELQYLNAPRASDVTGNSAGIRISFWPDEATLLADQAEGKDRVEEEDAYLLGMFMKGCSFERYGTRSTYYTAKLRDDLWMQIALYHMPLRPGSEAEAIVNSLKLRCGDFAFSYDAPVAEPGGDVFGNLFAGDFSLQYIEESRYAAEGKVYTEEQNGNVYVYNNLTAKELSFSHDFESEQYYSYADFDMAILYPGTEEELPLLRLWITMYTAGRPLDVTSVTFTADGKSWTFSELSDEEDIEEKDGGDYAQTMLILFDERSLDFLLDLSLNNAFGDGELRAVFHGTEDVEVTFGENFRNVFSMYWDLYVNSDGMLELDSRYEGTPMETSGD